MWITLSDQTVYFLASIAFGAALAAVYDLLRALRMLLRSGWFAVLVMDILFFAACGAATSLFALPFNKGNVRGFIVFGEAVGFLAYRMTIGSIFGKIHLAITRLLRQFIRKIGEKLKRIYDFLLKAAGVLLYNIVKLAEEFFRAAVSGIRILADEAKEARRRRSPRRMKNKDISRKKDSVYERKRKKARGGKHSRRIR